MIELPQITLFTADTRSPEMAVESLKESYKNINFGKVILFSDKKPFNITEKITFIKIPTITSLLDYSKFMLNILPQYIDTDFCLSVHADGFIINANNWKDEFLDYDYIGAPWTKYEHFVTPQTRVGNGGVSLRSKKLLELTKNLSCDSHEDTEICHRYRNYLESQGITYASLELAAIFSQEKPCDDLPVNVETDCFAVHGRHNSLYHKEKIKELSFQFYKNCLIEMDDERLFKFLNEEAGVSQAHVFLAKFEGNLQLQQIPDEYIQLLNFFKNNKIESYLELGVANGGSFFINSIFLQKTANLIHCVDCLAYKDAPHVQQTAEKILNKVNRLKVLFPEKEIHFFNSTTDDFFIKNHQTYDCIFIDADHSYEGVMKDYVNSLKFVKPNGWLIFHDINNTETGVSKCWNEVKNNHTIVLEASHAWAKNCGIGIIKV